MGRMERATSDVYEEMKEKAKEVRLNTNVKKTKAMIQNKIKRRSEILTINYHDTEVVYSFKYLGIVVINTMIKQKKSKLEF
jgi:hypothetical protein